MDLIIETPEEKGAVLTPAQSQLIVTNLKRVLVARDLTLLGRIAYRFLTTHFSFTHSDTHFNFVTHHQRENFSLIVKTIVNANKTTHENRLVEQTLEGVTALCQEAEADQDFVSSALRAA